MDYPRNSTSTANEMASNNLPPNTATNCATNNQRNIPTQAPLPTTTTNAANMPNNYQNVNNMNGIMGGSNMQGNSNPIDLLNIGLNDAADRLLAGLLEAFPNWSGMPATQQQQPQQQQPDVNAGTSSCNFAFNNLMGAFNMEQQNNFVGGPIGTAPRPERLSPGSNSSSIGCRWCDESASLRCLDCNEFMCNECVLEHRRLPESSNHSIIMLPTPIGTSPTGGISTTSPTIFPSPNYVCDQHNEMICHVCNTCKKLVCQGCTLHEHKDHKYICMDSFIKSAQLTIQTALESGNTGTKCIKSSIDRALAFIRLIDRNFAEVNDNIRKSFRQFTIAIEDRERFLLDFVERLRQRRLAGLHDQMAGLKSALSGLAETSEILKNIANSKTKMDPYDIATKIINGQRQLEQFALVYKDLQPKQETYTFLPPDFALIQEIRQQGGIICVDERNYPLMQNVNGAPGGAPVGALTTVGNMNHGLNGGVAVGVNGGVNGAGVNGGVAVGVNGGVSGGAAVGVNGIVVGGGNGHINGNMINMVNDMSIQSGIVMSGNPRRPLLRDNSFRNMQIPQNTLNPEAIAEANLNWEIRHTQQDANGLQFGAPRVTQAIPGSLEIVRARECNVLSFSFATEGHDDGQVSRPWGICVDKLGNIYVSDRRNNRVQVFNSEGALRFKFGRKGVNNGEFDLPAGICVDIDNRIIVVDKDNHRVQIFAANGVFLLKFGSYGKEYGQFQYPWDVAVNSRRQIAVTDSRNHRVQQFDSEGRFIRQIVFDTYEHVRGITSPRGITYTPRGYIIVSDFDNHCLYLIDPDVNEVVACKGNEGPGYPEFNRPSGLCCDDEGRIIVADSKNQRIVVFNENLEHLWTVRIRPFGNRLMHSTIDEKDRTCDVAIMPDGRIVFLIELSPDSKEGTSPFKRFVHVF